MSQWDGKSKGNVLGYKIFLAFINLLGVKAAYLLLRFVSLYYFLFSKKSRDSILDFYIKRLKFPKRKAIQLTLTNFYVFGQTLVDRFAFLLGKGDYFTYSFQGEHYLHEMNESKRGGILLGAHVGNWETAGGLFKDRITNRINVVMYEADAEKLKQVKDNATGGNKFNVIPVKDDLSHVIKIKHALDNNEFVSFLADRYLPGSKTMEVAFLGEKVHLPVGPFLIASKFNTSVTFIHSLKKGDRHYALSATPPITEKMDMNEIAHRYIQELERVVKKYPEQWFNYFDFFKKK